MKMYRILLPLLALAYPALAHGQILEVTNSPNQPPEVWHKAGSSGNYVAASFRLHSIGAPSIVAMITLTNSGTGNWATDITSVSAFRDNGNQQFDLGDEYMGVAASGSVVTLTLNPFIALSSNEMTDVFVILEMAPLAGTAQIAMPETFQVQIASASDVGSTIPVVLGNPPPIGPVLGAIEFQVTSFSPYSGDSSGGEALTILGTGFVVPFEVLIGGKPCTGTPMIVNGAEVTGLFTPAGVGVNLPIVVHSGKLLPQTIAQTFTYGGVPSPPTPPTSGDRITVEIATALYATGTIAWLGNVSAEGKAVESKIHNADPATTLSLTATPSVQVSAVSNCDGGTGIQVQPSSATIPPLGTSTFLFFVDPITADKQFSIVLEIPNNYTAQPYTLTVGGLAVVPPNPNEPNGTDDSDDSGDGCAQRSPTQFALAPLVPLVLLGLRRRREERQSP